MKITFKIFRGVMLSIIVLIFLAMVNYLIYLLSTENQVYYSTHGLKNYHHLLILGAGKKNQVFYSRMNATLKLYRELKITRITCSGLTGIVNYTEPYDMREYLLLNNIPDSIIETDKNGSHTLNSVENYAQKNKNDNVIIVSQAQHLNRALFIANCKGLNAAGYAVSGHEFNYNRQWFIYEYFARIKSSFMLIFY